ncbi:CBS domain-containing protein [Plesiomonas shigelloides]|uniref:CBS domain-containing protein n=1 Tax=Plesiomonas shigelloides TaxID=703 RepID=UPI001C49898F|nr:CBS domain-containing protein [Plesiomonas shigelloides]
MTLLSAEPCLSLEENTEHYSLLPCFLSLEEGIAMESIKVADYMHRKIVTLSPKMTLTGALKVLLDNQRTGAPVVDAHGMLAGFISEQDMIKRLLSASYHNSEFSYVSDLMRIEVLTVAPDDSVVEIAQMMAQQKPKIYPVCLDGRVVGIIDRHDIMRAIYNHLSKNHNVI